MTDIRMSNKFSVPEPLCEVSGETPREERANYITHLIGFIVSLFGLVFLIYYSHHAKDVIYVYACWAYGVTLVIMYGVSTYYHYCKNLDHKRKLKNIDYACIYLLIAGSYTPFTLGPLRDYGGLTLLVVIWTIAIFGTVFHSLSTHHMLNSSWFKPFSLFIYLGMGWFSLINFPLIIEHLPHYSIVLLLLGGVAYSIGVFFYLWHTLPYNHAIWHVFVLAGSACHYFSIFFMI